MSDRERYQFEFLEAEMKNASTPEELRKLSYKMRECCSDSSNVFGFPLRIKDVSQKPDLQRKLLEATECSICLSSTHKMIITFCSHLFCIRCIWKWVYLKGSHTCPLCRRTIRNICELYSNVQEERLTATSKAEVLLAYLVAHPRTCRKSVVFSQFKNTLENLSLLLMDAGFQTSRLYNDMSMSRKQTRILEFFAADAPTVLLANLEDETVNLTTACVGFIMDSIFDEQVVFASLHQIGQRKSFLFNSSQCVESSD